MRGTSALSLSSQMLTYQVKQDGYVGSVRVLPHAARRVAENLAAYPFLQACLGQEITLVPMPRSSLQRPGFLWPVQRICECLLAEGLGRDIEPCLIRTAPLLKASLAVPGQRPNPIDHYHSTTVRHSRRSAPRTITLVDDVVTRGASFIGMYARLREAYPNAQIRCFALIRTIRSGEIDQILDPVHGEIRYAHDRLSRVPSYALLLLRTTGYQYMPELPHHSFGGNVNPQPVPGQKEAHTVGVDQLRPGTIQGLTYPRAPLHGGQVSS